MIGVCRGYITPGSLFQNIERIRVALAWRFHAALSILLSCTLEAIDTRAQESDATFCIHLALHLPQSTRVTATAFDIQARRHNSCIPYVFQIELWKSIRRPARLIVINRLCNGLREGNNLAHPEYAKGLQLQEAAVCVREALTGRPLCRSFSVEGSIPICIASITRCASPACRRSSSKSLLWRTTRSPNPQACKCTQITRFPE